MKPIPFYKLSPKMKNIRMNNWIKQDIAGNTCSVAFVKQMCYCAEKRGLLNGYF